MNVKTIENYYRICTAICYLIAFLCQIPLLIVHMPSYIGVETSFNTYTPAVIMIIVGCVLFILDRLFPNFGDKFRLQLFSAILLSIGAAVWCICGVSWSTRLCNALFDDNKLHIDQCWGSTFVNFFAITCCIMYLTISVIDDLFTTKARLFVILFVNLMAFIHLILYLIVNSYGPHEMTSHLKFYYYFLIIFIATTITISILSICTPNNQYTNNATILSFSLVFITILCIILAIFLIIFGSINYWYTQKINSGDGAAFIGYSIFYSTANIWIMIELYLYKKHRIQMLTSSGYTQYTYASINQNDTDHQYGEHEQPNVII